MRHKHHIIPKHRDGTDEPSNIIEVSVTKHAMFHYCEWQLHKIRADYVAWQGLVGNLKDEEMVQQKLIMAGEIGGKKCKELGLGIFALTKEQRSKNGKKSGKIGGAKGGMSRSKVKRCSSRKNLLKAVEKAREAGVFSYEMSKERGIRGNKSQREKFAKEGRTIAEKKWIVTTPKGEKIEVSNLKKFCRENNLLPNKMCEVGKGKYEQHRGYSCKKIP